MNTTNEEKKATQDLYQKCRVYLNDNFHKFSEVNKIKISLNIISKLIPTKLEGDGLALNVTMMPTVELDDGTKLEPDIGETPGDAESTK